MRRFLLRFAVVWGLVVVTAAWWLLPPLPVYEIPASQSFVHLSSDGEKLLVVTPRAKDSLQRVARVYQTATGRIESEFDVEFGGNPLASRNGSRLIAASVSGGTDVWDTATGARLATLRSNGINGIWSLPVSASADGDRIAYSGSIPVELDSPVPGATRSVLRIWDAREQSEVIIADECLFPCFDISSDGAFLATAGKEFAVQFWDARSGELQATFPPHTFPVSQIAFSPDGRQLASAANGAGGTSGDRRPTEIQICDVSGRCEVASFDVPELNVGRLRFDQSGQVLVADGAWLGQVSWRLGKEPRALPTLLEPGAFSADGNQLALKDGKPVSFGLVAFIDNPFIRVIDTATGRTRTEVHLPLPRDAQASTTLQPSGFLPDNRTLMVNATGRDTLLKRLARRDFPGPNHFLAIPESSGQ